MSLHEQLPAIQIPVARPDLSGRELEYVTEVVKGTWISSSGTFVDKFERVFAEICNVQSALSVSNGTAALHLALLVLDVRPVDEVIVPSLTYVATANVVRYMGATPVFVDICPKTWCLDPDRIEEAITRRTRGIIPVHLYGHPADMDAINHIAAVHGLWVVEDAAEAPFARYRGRPTGSLATIGTFSFYGNKIISSGEGGALTLSDPRLALRARTLRGQGVDPDRRYFFPVVGYNFRLTNLACALLMAQLERREALLKRRFQIFATYRELLRNVPGIAFQPISDWADIAPWLFCITVEPGARDEGRDGLARELRVGGIETRPFFIPLHTLPPFRESSRRRSPSLPVTTDLAARGLNLPTYSTMSDQEVERVADSIRRWR